MKIKYVCVCGTVVESEDYYTGQVTCPNCGSWTIDGVCWLSANTLAESKTVKGVNHAKTKS